MILKLLSRTIKEENRAILKLPDFRKPEAWASTSQSEKFTLLSLGDRNNQFADAYNVTMRLFKITDTSKD